MEKLTISPPESVQREYKEIVECLEFVDKSRQDKPKLDVLEKHSEYLRMLNKGESEWRPAVNDFVVRFLAKSEHGLSTFDIFNIVFEGSEKKIDRQDVQRALWELEDNKIIVVQKDRRLALSPTVKAEILS